MRLTACFWVATKNFFVRLRLWRLTPAVLAEVEVCPAPRFLSLNGTIGTAKKIFPSRQVVLVALRSSDQYCYRIRTFNVYLESHQRFITKKQRQTMLAEPVGWTVHQLAACLWLFQP